MVNSCLIIYGPTGVGKSDLAEQLAAQLPAEIINMDLGQCYTPLTIGTAKPDWHHSPIKHHLFDILNEPRHFSVVEYRSRLLSTLDEIWSRGKLPVIVGGSGFYLKSIFFPPTTVSAKLDQNCYSSSQEAWDALHAIDSQRALIIDPHDFFRIKRALALWHETGQQPSQFKQLFNPPCAAMVIGVTRDRHDLYARINARVEVMFARGWQQEVALLRGTPWEPFLYEKKLIGYNELLAIHNDLTHHDTVIIAQRTRQYAKRQLTFWKMVQKQLQQAAETSPSTLSIEELNLTSSNLDLYIKQLSKLLLTRMYQAIDKPNDAKNLIKEGCRR